MAKSIKSKLTKADKNCPKLGHFTTNHKEPNLCAFGKIFNLIQVELILFLVVSHIDFRITISIKVIRILHLVALLGNEKT